MRIFATIAALFTLAFVSPVGAQTFQADSKISVVSTQVANNTTAIIISPKAATLYEIEAFNNSATIAYIKLYNAASGITCGSGTPQARYLIPALTTGALVVAPLVNGDAYSNGITLCVTTGYADSDTGSPAATTYIVNVHFKPGQQ